MKKDGLAMLPWLPDAVINTRGSACIVCHDGIWWLVQCHPERVIRLDPLLRRHKWNVSELSHELGLAPRSFSRIVERSVGLSAKYWLRHHRIVAACHLLREGWKIEALSADFGFQHPSAFSREFKSLVGVTPSSYFRMEKARFFIPPSATFGSLVFLWMDACGRYCAYLAEFSGAIL